MIEKWRIPKNMPIDMVHPDKIYHKELPNRAEMQRLKEKYPDVPIFLLPLKAMEEKSDE